MIRSIPSLNQRNNNALCPTNAYFVSKRHTKEELTLIELSWRDPPEDSPTYFNKFMATKLPKLDGPNCSKAKVIKKNFLKINKKYTSQIPLIKQQKIMNSRANAPMNGPGTENNMKKFNFKWVWPAEYQVVNTMKNQYQPRLKISQSTSIY